MNPQPSSHRTGRLVLGVVTVLPLVGIGGWLAYYWTFVQLLIDEWFAVAGDISPTLIAYSHSTTVLWGSVVLGLLLWAYYLTWVLRTDRLGGWAKTGWSLALCLAGLVAMPVL
ncbi:MAG: hypothetical protein GVY15_02480 [Bacteroidetes bacterium]|jgi:hypothetical protein|nr:hypothetical protein [Bacteroidota bacterium]